MSVTTDGMTLLPEPDWSKPLEHFCVDDKGRVLAAEANYGRWMPTRHSVPTISDWLNEAMWYAHPEYQHHVSSFVACGLRAVAAGVAPCGCRQRFRFAGMVSLVPCEKHRESKETWVRARERPRKHPEITGYTRAKRPTWDDIRPGQVWRWRADSTSGKLTGKVVQPMSDMTWLTGATSTPLLMHRGEFDRGEWTLVSDVEPVPTRWEDVRVGQVWRKKGSNVEWTVTESRIDNYRVQRGNSHSWMSRSFFQEGLWEFVRHPEPRDTIPSPSAEHDASDIETWHDQSGNSADLQPGIPGEPTYTDHRQRYLDAMLRGERLHPPEWDKRTGSYVQCACWHCQGCDAGQWSPWDKAEAERKIALAETAAKAVGYSLWTWVQGGRTDGDRVAVLAKRAVETLWNKVS